MSDIFLTKDYAEFFSSLKTRVTTSRLKASLSANKELILLYHHIGIEILERQRTHGWGAKIIDLLSKNLSNAFPEMKGFSVRNLKYMKLFAENYPNLNLCSRLLHNYYGFI